MQQEVEVELHKYAHLTRKMHLQYTTLPLFLIVYDACFADTSRTVETTLYLSLPRARDVSWLLLLVLGQKSCRTKTMKPRKTRGTGCLVRTKFSIGGNKQVYNSRFSLLILPDLQKTKLIQKILNGEITYIYVYLWSNNKDPRVKIF